MAANYFYPFGHGGGQFSVSSGSYPGGYSGQSSSSRGQQQVFNEQHSQLPYNAFSNQLEQNASYGENKAYYVSTSPSSSVPLYTSSASDDARQGAESKYNSRFQMPSTSLNSDNPSYLGSGATSSKSSYSGSKPSDNWQGAGAPGASLSHGLGSLNDAGSTQSSTMRVELPVFKASPSSLYYRNSATGNQSWGNVGATGDRKPLPFGARPRPRQPPKPSQLHYCEVCRISCAGSQTYMEHLEGKNHKKKEAQTKAAESSGTVKVSSASASGSGSGLRQLYCQLCDVACTGADTYAAHIRGAKHQKVLNLHTKLGKPIPEVQSADGAGGRSDGGMIKKVIVPGKMNFIGGSQLNATGGIDGGTTAEIADGTSTVCRDEIEGQEDVADVQPVGLEYIEESRNETGSAVSFHCKLCNCNFTDPLAKVMHTKGRRHRLNYKQKVDPTLSVSMKPGSNSQKFRQMGRQTVKAKRSRDEYWRRQFYGNPYRQEVEELRYEKEYLQWQLSHALERYDWITCSHPMAPSDSPPPLLAPICRQAPETQDDQHVKAKHAGIYPTEEDLAAVQGTVSDCESTLKFVSDLFASASEPQNLQSLATGSADVTVEPKEPSSEEAPPAPASPPRELKAVVRVGALSKGLLLHGNLNLELIVLCSNWPTFDLLNRVMEEFTKKLNETAPDRYAVSLSPEGVDLVVTSLAEPKTTCTVSLTSLSVKGGSAKEQGTGGRLDHGKCLKSLAALRHAKWFQGKASCLFSCVILVRILKDICHRIPTWSHLTHWSLELVVEKCLSSCEEPLQPGSGLRRILEYISSGLLLNGGPGLYDPCEKDPTDVFECLSSQQREDITVSAQHALRLLAFGQIHKILDMEPLPSTRFPAHRRKRQRAADCQAQQGTGVASDLQPAEN